MLKFNERGLDVHHARLWSSKRKNFVCVVWWTVRAEQRQSHGKSCPARMYTMAIRDRRGAGIQTDRGSTFLPDDTKATQQRAHLLTSKRVVLLGLLEAIKGRFAAV